MFQVLWPLLLVEKHLISNISVDNLDRLSRLNKWTFCFHKSALDGIILTPLSSIILS